MLNDINNSYLNITFRPVHAAVPNQLQYLNYLQ